MYTQSPAAMFHAKYGFPYFYVPKYISSGALPVPEILNLLDCLLSHFSSLLLLVTGVGKYWYSLKRYRYLSLRKMFIFSFHCSFETGLNRVKCVSKIGVFPLLPPFGIWTTDIHYINLDTKFAIFSVIDCFFIRRQNKHFVHCNISKMPIFGGF